MPKQIFQRPAPVNRINQVRKNGGAFQNDWGRKKGNKNKAAPTPVTPELETPHSPLKAPTK